MLKRTIFNEVKSFPELHRFYFALCPVSHSRQLVQSLFCALRVFDVFFSSFHRLLVILNFAVIGCCDNIGFEFSFWNLRNALLLSKPNSNNVTVDEFIDPGLQRFTRYTTRMKGRYTKQQLSRVSLDLLKKEMSQKK